jgi:hypothetical protein
MSIPLQISEKRFSLKPWNDFRINDFHASEFAGFNQSQQSCQLYIKVFFRYTGIYMVWQLFTGTHFETSFV